MIITMFKQIAILVLVSALFAGVNAWLRPIQGKVDKADQVKRIDVATALKVNVAGDAMFVDAREPATFDLGHIPGALNLNPHDDFETQYAPFSSLIPMDQALVVYCDGDECTLSTDLAMRLLERGYLKVSVLSGGMTAWTGAGGKIAREDH